MKISPVIAILCLMPLATMAQEVIPYAKYEVDVDWVPGTDFAKFRTYAWGTSSEKAPDPKHPQEEIDAALQAKGLHKVGMDANPSLMVTFSVGSKLVTALRNYPKPMVIKQGTLVVELAELQSKKTLWRGIAYGTMTDNREKDITLIQKKVSKMFEKFPPPTKK